jgi:hypothetical protein
MANEKQYKLKTLYVATRGVDEYRMTIEKYVQKNDRVLEIGCEWGTTSELIYSRCKNLVATDISEQCLIRARQLRPKINFVALDVYDLKSAMNLGVDFNKMYIDVSGLSGYRSLLDVIALMNSYASIFPMEAIIIKSGSLKNFIKNCRIG